MKRLCHIWLVRTMKKKNKARYIYFLLGIVVGLLASTLYVVNYNPIDESNSGCGITICDYTIENVSNGAVSMKFLFDKVRDYDEVVAFCKSKGYERGVQSDMNIFCDSEERHKYFPILKDFAEYIYHKYGGEQ